MTKTCDFLVVGAGIVGLTCALELRKRDSRARIVVLEKEPAPGRHSSGRNSGVLHSGIYYPTGSLKAKVCGEGSRRMAEYCREKGLPLNRIGKVLVPTHTDDADQLELLFQRAGEKNLPVERLDEAELARIEPEARSATGEALLVPSTAVVDSAAVLHSVYDDARNAQIEVRCGGSLGGVDRDARTVSWQGDTISYGHAINAAGLHADTVAKLFGLVHRLRLLPFKGLYWKLSPDTGFQINHLIYPVPDLRVPFLGIHTTTAIDGTIYLGPTSVPAFGRENYRGLAGIDGDFPWIAATLARQFVANQDGFRRLSWQEGPRYFKSHFVRAARKLLPRIEEQHLILTSKVGIRAQMFDRDAGRLITDFIVESGPASTHVLNAISPAFTSSFPLAEIICDQIFQPEHSHANYG